MPPGAAWMGVSWGLFVLLGAVWLISAYANKILRTRYVDGRKVEKVYFNLLIRAWVLGTSS